VGGAFEGRVGRRTLGGVVSVSVAAPAVAASGGNDDPAKACQHAGWESLGSAAGGPFANQGDCVDGGAQRSPPLWGSTEHGVGYRPLALRRGPSARKYQRRLAGERHHLVTERAREVVRCNV